MSMKAVVVLVILMVATAHARPSGHGRKLAQPSASTTVEKCSKCRLVAGGDFPGFGATCADPKERVMCCTSKGTSGLTCYARDEAHGGYSCADTYKKGATYGHCCFNCTP